MNKLIGGFEAVLRRACNPFIAVEISLASMIRTVSVDVARFEAALLNLVVNARDAIPNGGKLAVATVNVEVGDRQIGSLVAGTYVEISVSDYLFPIAVTDSLLERIRIRILDYPGWALCCSGLPHVTGMEDMHRPA